MSVDDRVEFTIKKVGVEIERPREPSTTSCVLLIIVIGVLIGVVSG